MLCSLMCSSLILSAQDPFTSLMSQSGKIYVVVAVIVAIFIGIVFFLIYLDRKLTKLENQIKEDE
ncbi:MAG TPA: CcmD family protein [Saprospiraceae bacterium]|nr:CcmD family protein [Saprospiraceae bacterium]HMQ82577.1 CcmD family protein [Saprospiraceae bacterium]